MDCVVARAPRNDGGTARLPGCISIRIACAMLRRMRPDGVDMIRTTKTLHASRCIPASRPKAIAAPHPTSHVLDDRETPLLWRRDGRSKAHISEKRKLTFQQGPDKSNRPDTAGEIASRLIGCESRSVRLAPRHQPVGPFLIDECFDIKRNPSQKFHNACGRRTMDYIVRFLAGSLIVDFCDPWRCAASEKLRGTVRCRPFRGIGDSHARVSQAWR
jgi:hypothetical protein